MTESILLLIFGLVVGSFLNACIHRIPRDISLVRPASSCPNCGQPIKPWDNIPVVSYLLLRGRCRHCGLRISPRYPLVELLNGLLYLMAGTQFGFGWHLVFVLFFISAMVLIAFIDLDFQIIPDAVTLPGIVIGLAAASFLMPDPFLTPSLSSLNLFETQLPADYRFVITGFMNSLIGLLLGGGLYYLIAVLSRGGMGGGDIKMMAMVGSFMGWKAVLLTTFCGSLAGSLFGIFLMIFKGKGRKTKIPFGPFLAAGSLVTLFFGNAILTWYLG
ncbi:MAG: prepilin peptidase [Nitrospiraceae bacterium]|nr:prepilin peptidase [Nitrospiraceae bacterium]